MSVEDTGLFDKSARANRGAFLVNVSVGMGGTLLVAACGGATSPTTVPAKSDPKPAETKPVAAPTTAAAAATQQAVQAGKPETAPTVAAAANPVNAAASASAGVILFGAPISLSGSLAKEGGLTREGYDIWKDTYNEAGGIKVGDKAYKIETKYYDDESSAQKSATLAEKSIYGDDATDQSSGHDDPNGRAGCTGCTGDCESRLCA